MRVTLASYDEGYYMAPHTHDFTAISLILKGGFEESTDGGVNQVCRAKTLIKPADTLHSDKYDDSCSIMCVYLKDISQIKRNNQAILKEWTGLYGVNWSSFQPYFSKVSMDEKRTILNEFIGHIQSAKTEKDKAPDWVYHLKYFLDAHFNERIQTSELADRYGVHPVYLARVFRKYFGMSIKDYLKSMRIRNAIASISENGHSLTQIAFDNGFADQSHFIRSFRQETGTTPRFFQKIMA